jgi:hypothetical protein
MIPKTKVPQIMMLCSALYFLVACSTSAKTSSPTLKPTTIPPVSTSTEAIPPSLEEILGNWQPLSEGVDAMYLQLNPDGTCQQAFSLEGLINAPDVKCTYILDGSNLVFTVVAVITVPPCPDKTGTYAVQMLAKDKMILTAVNDNCRPRKNSTAGEYIRLLE